tara:strand:- start:678 stop:1928 length:1251 start_codon:yes stop_codon:yes gene_type:complete
MIILLSIFLLFSLVVISKIITDRYFSPATIYPMQWIILILIAYFANFWYFETSLFYIVLFNLLYCIGFYSLYFLSPSNYSKNSDFRFSSSVFSLSLLISQIIAFLGSIIYLGIVIEEAGSLFNLFLIGGSLRNELLIGEIEIPLYIRMMSYLSLPNLVLSIIYKFQFKKSIYIYISIMNILLVSIAGMGRLNIVLGCIFSFWTMYYGMILFKQYRIRLIEKKIFISTALLFSVIIISFLGIQMQRIGSHGKLDPYYMLVERLPSYASGSLSAFGKHIELDNKKPLLYGQRMFSGIYDILGIAERKPGLYQHWYQISPKGEYSNVFTAFRLFLEDFGIIGFILIAYSLGLITSLLDKRIIYNKDILSIGYAIYILSIISMFFATCLTTYNSIIFGFIYLNIFLFIQVKYKNNVLKVF